MGPRAISATLGPALAEIRPSSGWPVALLCMRSARGWALGGVLARCACRLDGRSACCAVHRSSVRLIRRAYGWSGGPGMRRVRRSVARAGSVETLEARFLDF